MINKRDVVLGLLDDSATPPYVPAAFFLHFDPIYHQGQAAVDKHLDYFRATDMDFVKIQYERVFPKLPQIRTPNDWATMPAYGRDFFQPQLDVVEGLVRAAKAEAVVVVTLYSPLMCAAHTTGEQMIIGHLAQDPEAVKKGLEIITESILLFTRECVRRGVDGFYASTQGGEAGRLPDRSLFATYVKPFDLAVMEEINRACEFNILHICDYQGRYDDLTPFLDYPGDVVSYPLAVAGTPVSGREISRLFGGRPVMGGMDRHGALAHGTSHDIRRAAEAALRDLPERAILAADCTVPGDTPWDNLKIAIETAHASRR